MSGGPESEAWGRATGACKYCGGYHGGPDDEAHPGLREANRRVVFWLCMLMVVPPLLVVLLWALGV